MRSEAAAIETNVRRDTAVSVPSYQGPHEVGDGRRSLLDGLLRPCFTFLEVYPAAPRRKSAAGSRGTMSQDYARRFRASY